MKGLPVGTQPDRIFVWVLIKHKVNVYGTGLDSFAKYANRLPATVERWQLCFPLPFKHNSTDIGPTGPVIAIDLGTVYAGISQTKARSSENTSTLIGPIRRSGVSNQIRTICIAIEKRTRWNC